jgi:hypothetical protein
LSRILDRAAPICGHRNAGLNTTVGEDGVGKLALAGQTMSDCKRLDGVQRVVAPAIAAAYG